MDIFLVWVILGLCIIAIITLICIAVFQKKAKLFWAIVPVVLVGIALCCWFISENALKYHTYSLNNASLEDRMDAFVSGMRDGTALESYNPCDHNDFDGPIGSQENQAFSSFYLGDFILIVDKNSDLVLESLVTSEFPESLFSLSRAGYAIRNQFLRRPPSHGLRWMIQLTGVTTIQDELAFVFVTGEGQEDHRCSKYFKVQSKYAISQIGRMYTVEGNSFVFSAQMTNEEIPELTPDRDFGINILPLL